MRHNPESLALSPLQHHLVVPRPGERVEVESIRCEFCRQPIVPPYVSTKTAKLHPYCATELHLQRLEEKLDLLAQRFNLHEGLV